MLKPRRAFCINSARTSPRIRLLQHKPWTAAKTPRTRRRLASRLYVTCYSVLLKTVLKKLLQNLDIQYTVGIATNVPTTFISVGEDQEDQVFGFMDVINFLLDQDFPPQVLTTSYGADEGGISPILVQYVSASSPLVLLSDSQIYRNLCNTYAQLGARGTSILFASGDGGVGGSQEDTICSAFLPTFPSGCP